jgi:hypothetical protein
MVDCSERQRLSLAISRAVRDEITARRKATADPAQELQLLLAAREKLRKLREEYRVHVAEHGCLPSGGASSAASSAT